MPTLKSRTQRSSNGYTFTYTNGKISVRSEGTTKNLVAIFEPGRILDTELDFEEEISFWLYDNGAL